MPRTIRFHLDECCDNAVALGLRRRGIDVTTTPEVGLRKCSDSDQLSHARVESRILVTHDADLLRIHAEGTSHAGIVYRANDTLSIGELIRALVLVWEVYEPSEMANRVEYL
jgi:predicted nuclease of predicted toxin-antitoxin system